MNRINGKSFDVRFMFTKIHFESMTLDIEDTSTPAMEHGLPNGTLKGEKKASGEVELDMANFQRLSALALAAGSWENLPIFPIDAFAKGEGSAGAELMQVRAHGCKLRISSVLNINPNATDKSTVKLQFDVTSPDFVWINGTPYVDSSTFSLF
jgi:hypothetical protein